MQLDADASAAWTPSKTRVELGAFTRGVLGPYALGPRVRDTALGHETLAIHEAFDQVLAVETFDALRGTMFTHPDASLMSELAESARLAHASIIPIVGAGLEAGVPYVVRPHFLGRTLAELFDVAPKVSAELAACVVFTVADVTAWLAEQGSAPGACALGGFDARDVHLSYDGAIRITGLGLARVRCPSGDVIEADHASLVALVRRLDDMSHAGLADVIAGLTANVEVARAVRRRYREVLATRAAVVGGALRKRFDGVIREERAFFGMLPFS
ncbi:hypothetical protein L6R52_02155 [Myxococcota bacterium]|nr:hypothetical protein [Myxococcota bacterium]